MKKLALFLVLVMVFVLSGCVSNPTLSIPITYQVLDANGNVTSTVTYIFEEGWQDKETFTITYSDVNRGTVTVSDKCMIHRNANGPTTERYYDTQGRVIREKIYYPDWEDSEVETLYTYDEYGRLLTTEKKSEGTSTVNTYAYTDTDTGSKGMYEEDGVINELHYDHSYRQTTQVRRVVGSEFEIAILTETVYHEDGSISHFQYSQGKLFRELRHYYTQETVSAETAARLPWFR